MRRFCTVNFFCAARAISLFLNWLTFFSSGGGAPNKANFFDEKRRLFFRKKNMVENTSRKKNPQCFEIFGLWKILFPPSARKWLLKIEKCFELPEKIELASVACKTFFSSCRVFFPKL